MNFIELLNNYKPKQTGGKGDGRSPFDFDKNQVLVGLYVEKEHSNDPFAALGITLDHLSENESYYTYLIKSGIVDEPKALEYAKKYLNVTPENKENNKNNDEETDILLGFKPNYPDHYTNMNENFDFVNAELEYFKNPDLKNNLLKFEEYYKNWKSLSDVQKNEAYKLYDQLKMYKFDKQC
jgi:hypothetical protein